MELSQRADLVNVRETRNFATEGIELRELAGPDGSPVISFRGCASVTERQYPMWDMFGEYQETISRNAFDRSLGESPDVAFLINHEGMSLARTKAGNLDLSVGPDDPGLMADARFNPRSALVQELRLAVDDGNLDQMSFAFRVYDGGNEWNDDYDERTITGCNLHRGDVSAVNFGANDAAFIASMRHARSSTEVNERMFVLSLRAIEAELRAGVALSEQSRSALDSVLTLLPEINPEPLPTDPVSEEVDEIAAAQEAARSLELYRARALALRLRSKSA